MDRSKLENFENEAESIQRKRTEWWKPADEGDSITGIIEYIGEQTGKYGTQRVIKLLDARGVVWHKTLTSAMEREIEEMQLRSQDVITIKYFGDVDMQDGHTFKDIQITLHEKGAFEEDIPF
jgi:hypothetical protein